MGLFSTEKIHQPAMDARKVKDGSLQRYKHGFLGGGKWKNVHAILYSDSTFTWYDDKHDAKPIGSILLKDVVPYMCVGLMTDRMPIRRPSLPSGASVHHLVGIGMDPKAEKVHWFLFGSDTDLEAWFQEIVKTLPKPPTPPPQIQPQDGIKYPDPNNPVPVGFVSPPPPPYTGGGQPGAYPQPNNYPVPPAGGAYPAGGYRPQPQVYGGGGSSYYPPSGGPTTVIIDRTGGGSAGGGGFSSGPGFGTGMLGGALGGALLGYGLGSMFSGPHFGGGYGGGFGGGYGMGGGYYSDNDTTVNNYYNTTNNDTTNVANDNNGGYNPQDQPYDQNQGVDYNDFGHDDAGYDGGAFDGGYDDVGGGGFDSGDFGGGGDFSGGDFGDF